MLSPPIDIEWAWQCHMLYPHAYSADCQQLFGRVINHVIPTGQDTVLPAIWQQEYPQEPLFVSLDGSNISCFPYTSGLSVDIIAVAGRQRIFNYQIKLAHFKENNFVQLSIEKYKKFLHLKRTHTACFEIASFDVNLIWRTHLLHPFVYQGDTERIVGYFLNHDDSFLDSSYDTQKAWKKLFQEELATYGCMFRGEPSTGRLFFINQSILFQQCSKEATFKVESIHLDWQNAKKKDIEKLKIKATKDGDDKKRLIKLHEPNDSYSWLRGCDDDMDYEVDSGKHNQLYFHILKKKSGMFSSRKESTGECDLSLLLGVCPNIGVECKSHVEVPMSDESKLVVDHNVTVNKTGKVHFRVEYGAFQNIIVPENRARFWGPSPPSAYVEYKPVSFASHRLVFLYTFTTVLRIMLSEKHCHFQVLYVIIVTISHM